VKISRLEEYYHKIDDEMDKKQVQRLIEYWQGFCQNELCENKNQDFSLLLTKGLLGYRKYLESLPKTDINDSVIQLTHILETSIDYYINVVEENQEFLPKSVLLLESLHHIKKQPPKSLHQALQLILLFSQLIGQVDAKYVIVETSEYYGDTHQDNINMYIDNFTEICQQEME